MESVFELFVHLFRFFFQAFRRGTYREERGFDIIEPARASVGEDRPLEQNRDGDERR